MKKLLAAILALAAPATAGPISKFDAKPPAEEFDSIGRLEDIQRCLIDLDGWGAPIVYQQADRPDDLMLLWPKGGDQAGMTAFRLDLHRIPHGTHVKSWMPAKQALACAPR